jgi:hypothetical protein
MMSKSRMFPGSLLDIFDFAAANPMTASLMQNPSQAIAPILLLQLIEQSNREINRLSQSMNEGSKKAMQQKHTEDKKMTSTEESMQTQDMERVSFNLVYYNPILNETQVIPEEVSACVSDYAKKTKAQLSEEQLAQARAAMAADLAAGEKSTYPIYANIASPLVMERVDPVKLEIALSKIEIETPKPFGGGAAVLIRPEIFDRLEHQLKDEGLKQEIVAVEVIKNVEYSRRDVLKQIEVIIASFEKVITELEETEKPMDKVVKDLPELSRQRYLLLLKRKKKVAETLVVDMLITDLEFLIVVKKKLKKMSIRELIDTLKRLKRLEGLAVISTAKQT